MTTASTILPGIIMCGVSQEKAYDLIADLTEVQKNTTNETTVYTGIHKDHGAVHIVVTLIGDPIILPLIVNAVGASQGMQEPIDSPLLFRGDKL